MRIPMEKLKMYWRNFDRVASGDWTLSFAIAFVFGIILFGALAVLVLVSLVYLLFEHTVIFVPIVLVFTLYRLGYAAVKGK